MQSRLKLLYLSLAALAVIAVATAASAEPFCRTLLSDGRIILSRPVFDGNGLVCRSIAAVPMTTRQRSAEPTLPSMRFTTGEIGPFTTGEIGPFTTFSNTAHAPAAHR